MKTFIVVDCDGYMAQYAECIIGDEGSCTSLWSVTVDQSVHKNAFKRARIAGLINFIGDGKEKIYFH